MSYRVNCHQSIIEVLTLSNYVLAHDVGTGGNKASLVDINGDIVASAVSDYPVLYPAEGFAEQNPDVHWWRAITETSRDVMTKSNAVPMDVAAVTFSTQMMGTIPVDSHGQPLMNCMTWMDTRAAKQNKEIAAGPIRMMRMLWQTGGLPSAKDIIGKILWVKQERPQIYERTHKFLDCKDYLVHRSTGKFVTSWDCANLTWCMNTRSGKNEWSDTILGWMGIGKDMLPELAPSTAVVGHLTEKAASDLGLTTSTVVVNGCGDMTAAAVGSGAVRDKEVHLYAGSSAWLGAHVKKRKLDISTYTGSIRSAIPGKYLMIAEQESAGACLKHVRENWHCDLCRRVKGAAEEICAKCRNGERNPFKTLDAVAEESPPGSKKLLFAPWMFGERTPLDDHNVRGGYFNLSLSHDKADMIRAVMEGTAYHARWMMEGVEKRRMLGKVDSVNMVGGCANSDIWCQIYADILKKPVYRMEHYLEAGSVGAAMVAWVGLGEIADFATVSERVDTDKEFEPDSANASMYDRLYEILKEYYKKNKGL
ncbi:MAG: xylulokinase, partial [Promethearchaeati archaeon]